MRNLKFVLLLAEPEPGGWGGGKMVECKSLSEGLRPPPLGLVRSPCSDIRSTPPDTDIHTSSQTAPQHWLNTGLAEAFCCLSLWQWLRMWTVNTEQGWADQQWSKYDTWRHLPTPQPQQSLWQPLELTGGQTMEEGYSAREVIAAQRCIKVLAKL